MNRASLAAALEELQGFLREDAELFLPSHTREELLRRTATLLERAAQPGEVLYVGILGGTGVGKSTLTNALAGKKVSDPSDRRPFTDRAVVYRHRDTERGLQDLDGLIRDPDSVHDADAIRSLILLDLPDFDSIEANNRRTVEGLLAHLDAVVWVVSPEKYADAVFYQLLAATHIHADNFTFVLNKADELVRRDQADPFEKLKEVVGDLGFRLQHEAAVPQPRLFTVSALRQCEGRSDDSLLDREFVRFRDFLLARRDQKEIASIKTVNLREEAAHLLAELEAFIRPADKAALVESVLKLPFDLPGRDQAAAPAQTDMQGALTTALAGHLAAEDRSLAPVRLAMRLLQMGSGATWPKGSAGVRDVLANAASALGEGQRASLERLAAHMDSGLLLAFPRAGATGGFDPAEALIERAVEATYAAVGAELAHVRASTRRWRLWDIRFRQKLVLLAPLPLLALRLAGIDRVAEWFAHPSMTGVIRPLLALMTGLFGPEGLVGLAALLLCEALLVYWLAGRRIKKIEAHAARLARMSLESLTGGIDAGARRMRADRAQVAERLRVGLARLGRLTASFS